LNVGNPGAGALGGSGWYGCNSCGTRGNVDQLYSSDLAFAFGPGYQTPTNKYFYVFLPTKPSSSGGTLSGTITSINKGSDGAASGTILTRNGATASYEINGVVHEFNVYQTTKPVSPTGLSVLYGIL
jgi:hypothetical protein